MSTVQGRVRAPRTHMRPRLDVWSIDRAEREAPELTGQARHDYERELRIKALCFLMEAPCCTRLWRRVCMCEMYREIRARSADQRLVMELALREACRG